MDSNYPSLNGREREKETESLETSPGHLLQLVASRRRRRRCFDVRVGRRND